MCCSIHCLYNNAAIAYIVYIVDLKLLHCNPLYHHTNMPCCKTYYCGKDWAP